ncbi:uncharacterized protein [Amphiura filiformis]|uniref:uncharacterized protein n=1 Tax=Amphiura filiformis TaxID=82378 RepID=UPI003B2146A9
MNIIIVQDKETHKLISLFFFPMANSVTVTINGQYLDGIDFERLEDKLTIHFQNLKTGCDVDLVNRQHTGKHFHATYSFQFETSNGGGIDFTNEVKETKERRAVRRVLECSRTIKINERIIPFEVTGNSPPSDNMDQRGAGGFQDNKPSEELEYPSIQQQQLTSLEQHIPTPPVYSNPSGAFAETDSAQRYSSFDDVKMTSTSVRNPHSHISNRDFSLHSPLPSPGQEQKRDDDQATPFDSMMDMSRVSLSPQSFSMQLGARNTATPSNIPPLRADFETRPSNIAPLRADYETSPDHAGNHSDSSSITVLDFESRHSGIVERHASIDVSGYQNAGTVRRYFTKEAKLVGGTITEGGFVEDPRTGKINITFTDSKVVEAV